MPLKILYASSEAAPYAKTGGLGDVAGALPPQIRALGHDMRVVMPFHRGVRKGGFSIHDTGKAINVPIADRQVQARILRNDSVYFIENDTYYDRDELYRNKSGDYRDNAERFIFFSKAVLAACEAVEFIPDIVHCNDWQTGLTPLLLKYSGKNWPALAASATVFTVHNLAYQGIFWHWDLPMTNLGWELFNPEILEFYGRINFLKAGIVGADSVTTVSQKYAQEIQTPEYGCGLEGVLQARRNSLSGILNGVDYQEWSPQTDTWIAQRYSPDNLAGKEECRRDLLVTFGLKVSHEVPILGVISRLADQKGVDLIAKDLEKILGMGCVLIVLGTGEEKYHVMLSEAKARHADHIGLRLGFDNVLAHKIEAGSDMFLMPSRFEPCGLNQIYSMKYGTIPIVRATGGLDDTVVEYDEKTSIGNGFKFEAYSSEALVSKIERALQLYRQKIVWNRLVQNAMASDFSWNASALEYEKLYRATLEKKR